MTKLNQIYFRNNQTHAVACAWETWDDATLIEIEGDELKKKRKPKAKQAEIFK